MRTFIIFLFFFFWVLGFFHVLIVLLTVELLLLLSLINLFNSGQNQVLFILVLLLRVCLGAYGVSIFLELFRFKRIIHKTRF